MISLTTEFTEEELSVARRCHLRRRRILLWLFPLLGIAYIGWGAVRLSQGGSQAALYIVAIIVGLFLLFRTQIHTFRAKQVLRKNPSLGKKLYWTISESGIEGENDGSKFMARWDSLFETASAPVGFLLYPQKGLYYWLPADAFENKEDKNQVEEYLRTKTKLHLIR